MDTRPNIEVKVQSVQQIVCGNKQTDGQTDATDRKFAIPPRLTRSIPTHRRFQPMNRRRPEECYVPAISRCKDGLATTMMMMYGLSAVVRIGLYASISSSFQLRRYVSSDLGYCINIVPLAMLDQCRATAVVTAFRCFAQASVAQMVCLHGNLQ